jgi:hypothetical protein
MNIHLLAYYIGIAIIFITHLYMLKDSKIDMRSHAIINLVGGGLIAYYFMNREGFIKF